jgi:hypothetical protein
MADESGCRTPEQPPWYTTRLSVKVIHKLINCNEDDAMRRGGVVWWCGAVRCGIQPRASEALVGVGVGCTKGEICSSFAISRSL